MILLLIINEDKRILNKKKCQDLLSFVTFKELLEKSLVLKTVVQVYGAGDILNIF